MWLLFVNVHRRPTFAVNEDGKFDWETDRTARRMHHRLHLAEIREKISFYRDRWKILRSLGHNFGEQRWRVLAERGEKPPGPEALSVFESALAEPGMLRKVVGFARKRVFLLVKLGVGRELEADDLVNQVVVDTATGVLTWDPEKVALSTHLCGAIKGRTAKLIRRRRASESEESIDKAGLADPAAVDPVGTGVAIGSVVKEVKDHLFRVAGEKKDEDVQFLLMAYDEGIEGRSAIAEVTGLTPAQVTNARKRLDRYIGDMPPGLAEDARKAMN